MSRSRSTAAVATVERATAAAVQVSTPMAFSDRGPAWWRGSLRALNSQNALMNGVMRLRKIGPAPGQTRAARVFRLQVFGRSELSKWLYAANNTFQFCQVEIVRIFDVAPPKYLDIPSSSTDT